MLRIARDLAQQGHDAVDELAHDEVVEHVWRVAGGLAELGLDQALVGAQPGLRSLQHFIEQRLVATTVAQQIEQMPRHAGYVESKQHRRQRAVEQALQILVAGGPEQARDQVAHGLCHRAIVCIVHQPLRNGLGHVVALEPAHDVLGREEVLLDEAPQALADAVLVPGDDGGEGDQQPGGRRNKATTACQSAIAPPPPPPRGRSQPEVAAMPACSAQQHQHRKQCGRRFFILRKRAGFASGTSVMRHRCRLGRNLRTTGAPPVPG